MAISNLDRAGLIRGTSRSLYDFWLKREERHSQTVRRVKLWKRVRDSEERECAIKKNGFYEIINIINLV